MKAARAIIVLGLALGLVVGLSPNPTAAPAAGRQGPPLSQAALFSRAALVNRAGGIDLQQLEAQAAAAQLWAERAAVGRGQTGLAATLASLPPGQANQDWNSRPQNETAIATYHISGWIIGANDYGIGWPIGTGIYTHRGVNYFPPFPALFQSDTGIVEPPVGTGDPVVAIGRTRAGGGLPAGLEVTYASSLGFSATFCENGVFVYRSLDRGKSWTRPIVPGLTGGPLRTVVYQSLGLDCTIFHDKEWMTVDTNKNSPYKGRVYVTWTQFDFGGEEGAYRESPIMMAYSDDNANTWSTPFEVSGSSAALCPNQIDSTLDAAPGACDENQFSVPVVLSNSKVAIAFENEQCDDCFANGFRDQYLVTIWDPATSTLSGPYRVAKLFDGLNDYPISPLNGRQTICNDAFRLNSAGNIAVGPGNVLYVVWSDNRRHAGEFPYPTYVAAAPPHACPAGKATDVDVFISKSTDGGVTWSAPVRVNQDTLGNDRDQWFPWVAVASNGRVDVVFYDRRNDNTAPVNDLTETFLARSSNGGATWTDFVVSPFASQFDFGFFGTGSFIGDYNGLAVNDVGKSFPTWTGVNPGQIDTDVFLTIVP